MRRIRVGVSVGGYNQALLERFRTEKLGDSITVCVPADLQQARALARVIRAFDDYTKDIGVFRAGRKALLDALDDRQ